MFPAYVTLLLCLATLGNCDGVCTENNGEVTCGEGFDFPLTNVEKDITKLTISSKNLKKISKENLAEFTELEVLDLSDSGIVTIDEDAFEMNEKLTEINLSNNRHLQFPDNMASFKSKSLIKLNLTNSIKYDLPADTLVEMKKLAILDISENNIDFQNLLKILQNAEHLEEVYIMKDKKIDLERICDSTSVAKIISKTYDDEDIVQLDEFDCINSGKMEDKLVGHKDEETNKKNDTDNEETEKENSENKSNLKTNHEETQDENELQSNEENKEDLKETNEKSAEPENAHNEVDHIEECNSRKNLQFNGEVTCTNSTDDLSCNLKCRDGMVPDSPIKNPYLCSYKTGSITPNSIPNCIFDKINDEQKPVVEPDSVDSQNVHTSNEEQKPVVEPDSVVKQTVHKSNEEQKPEAEPASVDTHEMHNSNEEQKPVAEPDVILNSQNETNMHQKTLNIKMQPDQKIGESTSQEEKKSEAGISGSNVVLGIIVVIIVIGALGMGYKYFNKHRNYQGAKTEDEELGKELQPMNINKTNIELKD